jgi:streptomycin 6-kinase
MPALELPDITRRRALTLGAEGRDWLDGLDALVEDLCREWQLSLGPMLSGGSEAFVAACTRSDGRAAVLKVLIPRGTAEGERATLLAAGGRGYAELFASDPARRAMLMERLGPSLSSLGWSVEAQIESMLETLRTAWIKLPDASGFMTGAEKARSLLVFMREMWAETGRGWPAAVIKAACACAEEREAAYSPSTAVLGHGDGHSANTLLVPDSDPPRFKFVDPDGLFIEPAYDLGILMRDWTDELLAGDPLADGLVRCRHLAAQTSVPARAIWQWGFIERVSTGLLLEQLGEIKDSRAFRAVAEAWAPAEL